MKKPIELFLRAQVSKFRSFKEQKKAESKFLESWEKLDFDDQKKIISFIQPLEKVYCIFIKERKSKNVDKKD